ncbi:MAG: hypothetical protein U0790_18315 [Isosphaeraceae bacterium]
MSVSPFRPRLLEARTASGRADALCEFIEFWLGPRRPSYGEPAETLCDRRLPMPLRRLYEFAGRWPHWKASDSANYAIPAFSHQDRLVPLHRLTYDEVGKLVFLVENQGVWDCRTLPEGDDPPVWCNGDQFVEDGECFQGERLVSDSLSRFLTTFVIQELTFGSRHCLCDEGLSARFTEEKDAAIPVWTQGPYVYGKTASFYLWGNVLVADPSGKGELWLSVNHEAGLRFIEANQGSINSIQVMIYRPWSLDIRADGSARLRYLKWQTDESAEAPAGTFDFADLLARLRASASDEGHYERNALVSFHRQGQSGGVRCKHLHDGGLVTSLFRQALARAVEPNRALEDLFAEEWPL